jgi:hypothetical protein
VKSQLIGLNLLLLAGFPNQSLSKELGLAMSHHPADSITTENIENDV